jgi:cyclopropane fatty-acyl-phospholipid synthase-like methyltransferase
MINWKEYDLNGIEVLLHYDTHDHRWKVWFGSPHSPDLTHYRDPDLDFTNARGQALAEFLDELRKLQREKAANRK